MRQARVVKDRLAETYGDRVEIDGRVIRPFPRPQRLLEVPSIQGLSQVKVERLHGLAQAAIDGVLDTERLRSLPEADALPPALEAFATFLSVMRIATWQRGRTRFASYPGQCQTRSL